MTAARSAIDWVRHAKISPDGGSGDLRAYKVVNVSDYPDSIECHTWDGTDEGDETVHVARPWWLRRTPFHGMTIDGILYTYMGNTTRDELKGGKTTRKTIQAPYSPGNIIWATPDGRSGVTVDDKALEWIDDNRTARDWTAEVGASDVIQMRVQSADDNHIVARTWDAEASPQEGTTDIKVAKPWLLRLVNWEGVTRDGIKYTKIAEWQRTALELSSGNSRLENVEPRYFLGDIIDVANPVVGDVALTVMGEVLKNQDLNAEARKFHKQSEFGRPGILWVCGGVNDARRIFVIDPTNFCPICELKSPGLFPSGLGGDHDVMHHCDKNTDTFYKFNTTTLEIDSEFPSIDITPNGMGGTVLNVWHCDATTNLVYRLDPDDYTVDYSSDLGVDTPSGIGGDDGVVWMCTAEGSGSLIFKLLASTLGLISSSAPAFLGTPAGIGGDSTGIWYCDADDNGIYELATDLTVLRKRIGPADPVKGIGGKLK